MKFLKTIVLVALLGLTACGRPDFGSTTEVEVVDTTVDRASGGDSPAAQDDNNALNNTDGEPEPGVPDPASPPVDAGGQGGLVADFPFAAYGALADQGRNIVLAPHALARSLVIAHAAAGPEEAAIVASSVDSYLGVDIYGAFNDADLGLEGRENAAFQMLAGVWLQEDAAVETDLADTLAMYLGLPLRLMDFAAPEDARTAINNWYAAQTAGQVSEVLGPRTVGSDTRFLITDATYFSGRWAFGGFDPGRTTYETFAGSEANVQLPMMAGEAQVLFVDGPDFDAAVLPFDNGFSLIAVLPDSISGFESSLSAGFVDRLLEEAAPTYVSLRIPRLEVSDRVTLSSVAGALGVEALFADGAEFDGFADGTRLDDAHQRTKVVFTEEGVEVQGDSGAPDPGDGAADAPSVEFHLDRPFFFAIRDAATGRYLVLGRLAQP